jgi:hypothetical protein
MGESLHLKAVKAIPEESFLGDALGYLREVVRVLQEVADEDQLRGVVYGRRYSV